MFYCLLILVLIGNPDYLVSATNKVTVKNHDVVESCSKNESCVRFCCDEDSSCTENDNFDLKSLKEAENLDLNYKVLIGRPDCEMFIEDFTKWEFLKVFLFPISCEFIFLTDIFFSMVL